jgi:hypothetical protein
MNIEQAIAVSAASHAKQQSSAREIASLLCAKAAVLLCMERDS